MAEKNQEDALKSDKSGGKKKLVAILGVVVLLVAGGAGAYFFLAPKPIAASELKQAGKAAQHEVDTVPPMVMALDIFTANLQPHESEKYLQIGLALKFSGGTEGGHGGLGDEAIKPYVSDIRNAVLTKLAELKSEDVTGNVAREQLRSSIKSAIEKVLPASERVKFKDVLFTQFVVQ